jgi:hypothetical protein
VVGQQVAAGVGVDGAEAAPPALARIGDQAPQLLGEEVVGGDGAALGLALDAVELRAEGGLRRLEGPLLDDAALGGHVGVEGVGGHAARDLLSGEGPAAARGARLLRGAEGAAAAVAEALDVGLGAEDADVGVEVVFADEVGVGRRVAKHTLVECIFF